MNREELLYPYRNPASNGSKAVVEKRADITEARTEYLEWPGRCDWSFIRLSLDREGQ